MPLQRHRVPSLRGTRSPSSLDSPPASRTSAVGSLVRAPGVYVGVAPSVGIGGLGARVTRRALGISSVFLQGLRSSGLATVPAPGPERDHTTVEDLGGCLVEYMTKVHALEQVSQELETQLRAHLESKAKRSGGWDALRTSWASSYQQVGEAVLENARLMLQMETIQASADDFKERYENEQPFRKAAEEEVSSLYKVIDEANLTKTDLEHQIESLKEELVFLSRSYEEDVKVLYKQLAGSELEQTDAPMGTGLDDVLETIRVSGRETWKRTEQKQEPCSKLSKRGLENTLHDAQHWHDMELQNLGAVVGRLEAELAEIRSETEQQQQERAHLLACKSRLQKDVASYHALLDREESKVGLNH
ncbi:Phakinin [Apodemus speciosus]|uniref:Phakinin n=1 Tax=Apodemus speciosus TaxID=105296 RepID=A0ABQ0F6B3_APOSI